MDGIVFVFTNEYNIGIESLTAMLKARSIPVDIVLSKYNFLEMAHLQYMARHHDASDSRKALELLRADEDSMVGQIKKTSPRVVGFSVTTDSYRWNLSIASKIRKSMPSCRIVMGGAHPTFVPERVIVQNCIDAVCLGEVDLFMAEAFDALSGKTSKREIPGFWFKEGTRVIKNGLAPLVQDLDSLPFKDVSPFVRLNRSFAETYVALTARGCPFNCSYCNSSSYKKMYTGKYLRKRSPASMLAELDSVKKNVSPSRILFVDDVFTMDYDWLSDFLPRYKETVGLPYYCLVHPDMVEKKTICLLKDTGCDHIKCGIQSINPAICKNVYNRSLDLGRIRKVIRDIKDAGITIKVDFIIGAPTETEKDLVDLISFIKEIRVDDIFLYFLKYYPGSKIIADSLASGYITPDDFEAYHEGLEQAYQVVPERFHGRARDLYIKYNRLIREAAGSKFNMSQFNYLLEDRC